MSQSLKGVAFVALSLLSACGSTSATDKSSPVVTVTAAEDGCAALDLAPPAPGEGIQVSIDMELAPGEERQVCKLVLAGQDVNMNWSEGMFTKGSHHANVLATTYTDTLPTEDIAGNPVDASQAVNCETLASNYLVRGLLVARVSEARSTLAKGTLPDDVALKISANDVLELNFHMINTSENPVHACDKENLYSIPPAQVKQPAGVMFWYDNYITVPAESPANATIACPITQDLNLVQQVSHMHQRAVNYRAALLDGDPLTGANEVQQLYQTKDWGEPVALVDSPALPLKQGQWIRWSCDYQNTEARNIAQGQQTTDEMCMFIGLYWPQSLQMDWCMGAGSSVLPYGGARQFGSGTMNGQQYSDCWAKSAGAAGLTGGGPDSAAARYAAQRCVTESCPNVSAQINDAAQGKVDITKVGCNNTDGGAPSNDGGTHLN